MLAAGASKGCGLTNSTDRLLASHVRRHNVWTAVNHIHVIQLGGCLYVYHIGLPTPYNQQYNAKKIFNCVQSSEEWKRPSGRPQITWMKTVLDDLKSNNLTVTEGVNMAQNQPVWRLLARIDR